MRLSGYLNFRSFNTIQRGKRLTKSNQIKGLTPYISSSGINNGLDNFISNSEKLEFLIIV